MSAKNDMTVARRLELGQWEGARARITLQSGGRGRQAAWLARLDGLDLDHTFARTFRQPMEDARDRYGRGSVMFLARDGFYEAQSWPKGRVIFRVSGGHVDVLDVQQMLELLREDLGVEFGEVRSSIAKGKWSRARLAAFSLAHPGERRAANMMIARAALGERALPALTGTELQVQWAEDVRLAALVEIYCHSERGAWSEAYTARAEQIGLRLQQRVDARWWIEHRKEALDLEALERALGPTEG